MASSSNQPLAHGQVYYVAAAPVEAKGDEMVLDREKAVEEQLYADMDDDEDYEKTHEQMRRITSTARSVHSRGRTVVAYTSERGDVRTIVSRKKLSDKPAAKKMPKRKTARVMMVALFACIGSALFGLDIGYIGPLIESKSFMHDIPHIDEGTMDPTQEGLIVSLFSIGAMVTAFPVISSYFLDVWGRKNSIMAGTFVFILGSVIQGTAHDMRQLLVGRFVAGMSIGLLSSVIVLYQSELAPASMRGALSTLYQLGITFGILLAAYIDQMIVDKPEGWRMVMAIICMPASLLIFGMSCLPRSPRWLVQVGQRSKALEVLLKIRSEEEAIQEHAEIVAELEKAEAEGEASWGELFKGRVFRLLVLGVSLQMLQQLVGMNAFMYFGPKIFAAIGFDKNKFTTINNFVNFLSTFPAIFLADVAGRSSLMMWSAIGMTISCFVMGGVGMVYVEKAIPDALSTILYHSRSPDLISQVTKLALAGPTSTWPVAVAEQLALAANTTVERIDTAASGEASFKVANSNAGWVIAVFAFFFVFNFAYGFGPIVWVYCAEIFPLRARARCVGVCTLANWVGNFIIAQFTPMLLSSIQFNTFFVFGFFCLISVGVSWWLPETKGVPLELIQKMFDTKKGFRSTAGREFSEGNNNESSDDESETSTGE